MTDQATQRAVSALEHRITRAGGLADGTDPRALAVEYLLALRGQGWRHYPSLSTTPDDLRRLPAEPSETYRQARTAVDAIRAYRRATEEPT